MISDDELQTLTDYIVSLESQVQFLMKERLLYREGPAALLAQAVSTASLTSTRPLGNAGQPILTTEETYALFDEIRPPRPVKKSGKPD